MREEHAMAMAKARARSDIKASGRGKRKGGKAAPSDRTGVVKGGEGELSEDILARISDRLGIPASRVSDAVDTIRQAAEEEGDADRIVREYRGDQSALIQILLEIQKENRWLPRDVLMAVCRRLGVPLGRAYRIATFYKAFSLVPQGRHQVSVCLGTACHVRGAPRLLDRVVTALDIEPGETSPDQRFTLETVNCLGCCALGPVLVVDGEYHSNPSPKEFEGIVSACD
jgi:NADH-quinone oxidoreductase subunit E